jgi:hypothetical protein
MNFTLFKLRRPFICHIVEYWQDWLASLFVVWVTVNRPASFFQVSLENIGALSLFCFGINSAVVDTDSCKNCLSIFRQFLSPLTHSGK